MSIMINSAHAGYNSNQDKEIVGKTLWAYFDSSECRSDFKIYTPNSSNETFAYDKPVQIKVINLSNNWITGPKYELLILDDNKTKGYIYYNDLNFDRGYTKHLYYTLESVELVYLKNACLTNITPETKNNILNRDLQERNLAEKLAKDNDEKLRLQREFEKQLEMEKQLAAEAVKNEEIQRHQQQERLIAKQKYISDLPNHLKEMESEEFCQIYGNHIRRENENYDNENEVIKAMSNELKRRKLALNNSLIIKQAIELGISQCQLYASLGYPADVNTSVGSWGVHKQHIYKSNRYVYTENGTVTSWQY